jgi:chemotaxis protein methyltransferase CheR
MAFQDIKSDQIIDYGFPEDMEGYLVNQSQFEFLSGKIKKLAGINLEFGPKNLSLVSSRLNKLVLRRKVPSLQECIKGLRRGDPQVTKDFISIMTTNTTSFFREPAHFDWLTEHLPAISKEKREQGDREFRIWCSASSTGEEVYTILITLIEAGFDFSYFSLRLLATDIDLNVLAAASKGVYLAESLKNVNSEIKEKYFSPYHDSKRAGDRCLKVKQEYRNMVHFAPFNLKDGPYPFKFPFDVIFCRNVLIYFEFSFAEEIINNSLDVLKNRGLLFLGHSESGFAKRVEGMEPIVHSLYRNSR